MRTLTAVLVAIALWLVSATTVGAEGLVLEHRLRAGGTDVSLRLGVETDRGLTVRGDLGAGSKQYNFRLRLDGSGVHVDTGRGAGTVPRTAPPRLEDV
jgi:hypothetical protein